MSSWKILQSGIPSQSFWVNISKPYLAEPHIAIIRIHKTCSLGMGIFGGGVDSQSFHDKGQLPT